jgi:hypothetical protein
MDTTTTIQRAPGASMCCDAAGRMCSLAVKPVPLDTLVRLAVERGDGTEAQVRARIEDMLASGLLIES